MTQKIVENIAIAKAVCLRRTASVRVSRRKLTKVFYPCHDHVQRYEDAQWEHALMSNPGFVKYIQTLEAMTEAMEGTLTKTSSFFNFSAQSRLVHCEASDPTCVRAYRHVPVLNGGRARVLPRQLRGSSASLVRSSQRSHGTYPRHVLP